ncbi:MAG: tyrosine decarboxylase MfnA [Spirochaetales bacterium]|nr:tyrosine decarboxylase MfnA [Spirochaetales bacterium]
MNENGIPKQQIINELEDRLRDDIPFDSGRILGSMCTAPHLFAREIFSRYLEKNIGDPGLCSSTRLLENEAIGMLGELLYHRGASGYIVTGGTEANILAMWTALKAYKNRGNEVIVPVTAHFSFDKAGDMLGLKLVKVGLNDRNQMDIGEVKKAINGKTIALVGVAGSTDLGIIDPITALSEIAQENDLYLHVDAAFGGYVIPFLKDLGYALEDFDFRLPGVQSITIDPHKMGLSPIPAGGILYRSRKLSEAVLVKVPYLSGGENAHATIVGTRSGAAVLSVWALLKYLGISGYKKNVEKCMDLTFYLKDRIAETGDIEAVMNPVLNVIGIASPTIGPDILSNELRKRGWAISLFSGHIRIVIMPHVRKSHIDRFLKDLKEIAALIKERKFG